MALFNIGDLIAFSYPAIHLQGTRAHDKYPQVLVLHNNWQGLVHGLNFNYLTDDEINLLRMIIDPSFQLKYFFNLQKKNPSIAQEFDRIIGAAGNSVIISPLDFYNRVIKPFIRSRGGDPYRRYKIEKMRGARVVQRRRVMMGEQKLNTFGTLATRDKGTDEKEIMKNLAMKQAKSKIGYQLTPTEKKFIERLQGRALNLFQNYVKRFQAMRGSRFRS